RSDEDEVTELIQNAILGANSPFENWLHRDLLFAGLCLADDIGVSVECESTIIEQIIYIYLTSPYNTLRSSFSQVLNAWRDTPVAEKAINAVLALINQQKKWLEFAQLPSKISMSNSTMSEFEKKVAIYNQRLFQLNSEVSVTLQ